MPRLEAVDTLPDEPLVLPLRGRDGKMRDYAIEPVDAETWYKFSALGQVFEAAREGYEPNPADIEATNQVARDLGALGTQRAALGEDVVKQMLADGVSSADFRRAYTTALVWHTSGGNADKANEVWSAAGKARTPETATSQTSTSTAAASTTKRPASTSGTSSRRSTTKAKASPGKRSGRTTT